MQEQKDSSAEEREYPHWNRVYAVVLVYTAALIVGIWLFSRAFQ